MWLLDANMDPQLVPLLAQYGIKAESVHAHGWSELSNGNLVGVAVKQGYKVLVTRDKKFGTSASKALAQHPEFAVVLIFLWQMRRNGFMKEFKSAWQKQEIIPIAGQLIQWPTSNT